ncbi:MAG: precorrin-6A reductase [Oscillospiraceae bacterium]|nr:precorrin-6A reductase [Oscillospiraceae bacterium]
MYKLCVFAGTTEGRRLVELLADAPVEVTACVATEYGEALLTPRDRLTVSHRRLTEEEMEALLARERFDLVVDATHPYAAEVTENIAWACRRAGVEYLRLLREADAPPEGAVYLPDTEAAVNWLAGTEGNILLTTGSKELAKYAALPGFARRVYARVLPMEASLSACRAAGLGPDRIIAMQGPFSREMNAALLGAVSAKYLVTKDTGGTGGFGEKAAAARDAGAVLVVIGRPAQREGLGFAETVGLLCSRFGLHARPRVDLVGIGPGGTGGMTGEARQAIREADCLIGARRMLEAVRETGQTVCEAVAPDDILQCIRERQGVRRFAVVLSGDTGFFSGARRLLPLLKDCETRVLPGLSSMQVLCARLGTSYEDVVPVSLHGRDGDIVPDVARHRRVFALVGGPEGAAALCRALTAAGLGQVQVTVGERLGYPEERLTAGTAAELAERTFDPLSAVLIENENARPFVPGLPDDAFQRGEAVPMTKREVRCCALSHLALTAEAVCWDVGAGTGSVSIEMALLARKGRVYAVEKNENALALLAENRKKFHVSNLEIVPGRAPEACRELPAPTHVFIGGSTGGLRDIAALVLEKNPNARLVLTAITLESVAEMERLVKEFHFADADITCLNVSRARELGSYHLMTAQNPVYLFTLQRREGAV